MKSKVIHRLPLLATYCYDLCLVAEEPAQLGIVVKSAPLVAPQSDGIYLALIDLQDLRSHSLVVSSENGPGLHGEKDAVSDVLLRYDARRKRWVVAQLHQGHLVALRTLTVEPSGKPVLSPLCLLDREEDFERGFNPLLGLEIEEKIYRVLTHRAALGHRSARQVRKLEVALGGSAWNTLRDPSAIIVTGDDPLPSPPQGEEVVLPEEATFDPLLPDLSWNSAARLVANEVLATAENAMVFSVSGESSLLVLASPEQWVSVQKWYPERATEQNQQWRVWLTGWDGSWTIPRWKYTSQIGLPAASLPAYEYPTWPVIEVAISNGPAARGESVVVAMRMYD
ncbi:MAG TPA: hypothetical protein VFV38_16460, partial [Ktedonobacteraceae bacterium]|nr:hypothetical protein [Ktedonobacteraceae bacterium]